MRIRCEDCGATHQHFEEHRCAVHGIYQKKPKKIKALNQGESYHGPKKSGVGTSIHLRLSDEILEWIDATRGKQTRPERIRDILVEALGEDL
jgi:hypothetical protein